MGGKAREAVVGLLTFWTSQWVMKTFAACPCWNLKYCISSKSTVYVEVKRISLMQLNGLAFLNSEGAILVTHLLIAIGCYCFGCLSVALNVVYVLVLLLFVLHTVKLYGTYSVSNRLFRVYELLKRWFYWVHPPVISWESRNLSTGLLTPTLSPYPVHHTDYIYCALVL